jgi:hypothetical protein
MVRMSVLTSILVAVGLAACSSTATPTTQTITGKLATSSFPESVTAVRAVGSSSTVEATIAADGSFSLTLPAGDRYRISMVSAVRESTLVFPRASGTIDTSFALEGAVASRDVGTVRYMHDAADHSFDCDNECTPGSTTSDGTVCVHDDNGSNPSGDGSGAHPEGDGSGGTGTPPDGTNPEGGDTGSGGSDPGAHPGGDGSGAHDGDPDADNDVCGSELPEPPGSAHADGDAAICDQNLPPTICGDGGSEGDGDHPGAGGGDTGAGGGDTGSGGHEQPHQPQDPGTGSGE